MKYILTEIVDGIKEIVSEGEYTDIKSLIRDIYKEEIYKENTSTIINKIETILEEDYGSISYDSLIEYFYDSNMNLTLNI